MALFLYEDGQGNVLNEDGEDAMAVDSDTETIQLEQLTNRDTHIQYLLENAKEESMEENEETEEETEEEKEKETQIKEYKKTYTLYSDTQKYKDILYTLQKLGSARKAGIKYDVNDRTAQRWWKAYMEDPNTFFDPKRRDAATKKLDDGHKEHLIKYLDENPSAVIDQVMESLAQQFDGLDISKTSVHRFMTDECQLTFKKSATPCGQKK
ncbi:hypothetical protein Unana1_02550 [Umbelopsis nana]